MKNKDKQKRLKQSMAMLKIKIENLKPHLEESERLNGMYNKMLIEKAAIKKELDDMKKQSPNLLQKITGMFRPKEKKLISDYFNS